jgi:RimJ/RimL family protein N-acetyltransferase/aryl carrier-like protein
MTTESMPVNTSRSTGDRRAGWRQELAELLELEPATLTDDAALVGDLGLDSLAMMSLFGWLDTHGVSAAARDSLRRVGDVLALLERLPANGVSVTVVRQGHDSVTIGPAAVPGLPAGRRRSPLVPVLDSPAYRLTPVQESDLDFLYLLSTHPETGYRWRYRGNPPRPDEFAAGLWGQVLVQFVARDTVTGDPAGLVVAYAADLTQGFASVAAVFSPQHSGMGLAAEITTVFVRYLFHTFRLRKLYLEVPGFNWPQVSSGAGSLFQVEGVLREHDYYAGRYWDKYMCAIYPQGG